MSEVAINYKDESIATMDASGTKTLLTHGKYCEDDIEVVYTRPTPSLQSKSKTYTPTTSQQTESVIADSGYNGLSAVNVTVNAMPTGSAGTPTATKGSVSNHSVSVTPSVTNTAGYISGGTKTGTAVSVSASELVSGNKAITANGTGINVTNYATVSVAVSTGFKKATQWATMTDNSSMWFEDVENEPSEFYIYVIAPTTTNVDVSPYTYPIPVFAIEYNGTTTKAFSYTEEFSGSLKAYESNPTWAYSNGKLTINRNINHYNYQKFYFDKTSMVMYYK